MAILRGDDPDPTLLIALGGPAAPRFLAGETRADVEAWSRVWAARGLLWALDETTASRAVDAIVAGLADPAWRVREKAAQVIARHLLDPALDEVAVLRDADPVERVRAAAQRAVQRLTAAGA